jgi:hypothetical protein
MVYSMREFMMIGVASEVRNQLVEITGVGLEGTARGEMDVSNDLVHTNSPRDVAAFV